MLGLIILASIIAVIIGLVIAIRFIENSVARTVLSVIVGLLAIWLIAASAQTIHSHLKYGPEGKPDDSIKQRPRAHFIPTGDPPGGVTTNIPGDSRVSPFKKLEDIQEVCPCQFKIVDGDKPVENAEIELRPVKDHYMQVDFKGVTGADGIASINSVPVFKSDKTPAKEGVPSGEYRVKIAYKYFDKDFQKERSNWENLRETVTVTEKGLKKGIDISKFEK